MKINSAVICALVVSHFIFVPVVQSVEMISSLYPVVVNLRPSNPERKWATSRTSPLFFQRLLGIIPGQKWDFDVEKIKAIEKSGLFKNLTIAIRNSESGIQLNISGCELPSIAVSPELSFATSIEKPDITGGVRVLSVALKMEIVAMTKYCYLHSSRYLTRIEIFVD
jgi:hypothetical protein